MSVEVEGVGYSKECIPPSKTQEGMTAIFESCLMEAKARA